MPVETEDSSRTTWFQGTVSAAVSPDIGLWARSPWRMLQVTWDEPEVLENIKNVNPWQVELVSGTPHIQSPYPVMKKLRVLQNPEMLGHGDGKSVFPMAELNNPVIGSLNPSLFRYNTFPAGMQGARHDPMCVSTISNFLPKNTYQIYFDNMCGDNTPRKLPDVSTELNIGGASLSESPSPHSQSSIHYHGSESFGSAAGNPIKKGSGGSFQLFGQIIHTEKSHDAEADAIKESKGSEGAARSLDFSHPCQSKQMLDNLVVQCQRVQTVEACFL